MILGTAGHIDHGKTSLVRALTGVDTDRLPEEKQRGITIELGFAPLEVEGVGTIGIVDVPGHEAFVRTMLAGATGIDLALIVIAADEGLMPQTREHLAILDLLGVRAGVIAITKSDLSDSDWIDLVEEEARAAVGQGPLAAAEIVRCSATTGAGLDALREAIRRAALGVPARATDDLFRMPLDRAFSVKGTGTVVTGTVWSGAVRPEDAVLLLPAALPARVRGIESHGSPVPLATSGARAALALGGIDRAEIEPRGTVLVQAGDPWVATQVIRADVALLDGAPTLGPRTRVRLHLGTADLGARLVAVGRPVTAGARIPVRIALDGPLVARAGDRFVLRSASPAATIGGGVVTDPMPAVRRTKPWPETGASNAQRLAWILDEAGGKGVPVASLTVRLGVRPAEVDAVVTAARDAVLVGGRLFGGGAASSVRDRVLAAIDTAHRLRTLEPGASAQSIRSAIRCAAELVDHTLAVLVAEGAIDLRDGFAARRGWSPGGAAGDEKKLSEVRGSLEKAGHTPPSVEELTVVHGAGTPAMLKLLARRGEAVQVSLDRYFATQAVADLTRTVTDALANGAARTTSELREATGLTRKYVIPFLEYCDRSGITVRRGDVRLLAHPKSRPTG